MNTWTVLRWNLAWWEIVLLSPFLLLPACGGAKWTTDDAKNAADIANGALSAEDICDRDGGPCPASGVRAMERGTYCAAASMLARHELPVPDGGGIACTR
jgi:hypothetical protein